MSQLDPQHVATAATGTATSAVGALTALQYIQTVLGITASIVGIVATGFALWWGYRRHRRGQAEHRQRMGGDG